MSVKEFIKKNSPKGFRKGRESTLEKHHKDIKTLISNGYTLSQVCIYLISENKVSQIKEPAISRYVKKHNLRNAK